jgi:hypothetical protein
MRRRDPHPTSRMLRAERFRKALLSGDQHILGDIFREMTITNDPIRDLHELGVLRPEELLESLRT